MATSHTYESLTDALQLWEENTGAKFLTQIDTMIGLGESKLLRDLGIELFNAKYPITISAGNQLIERRAEFIAVRTVSIIDADGNYQALTLKTNEFLDEYWRNPNNADEPEYYTEYNEQSIRIVPTPDQNYVGYVRGIVRPKQLSEDADETWLSQKCGDLLFFACLIAAEIYVKEDMVAEAGRIAGLKVEYAERLATAKTELRMEVNADYSPITATPDA